MLRAAATGIFFLKKIKSVFFFNPRGQLKNCFRIRAIDFFKNKNIICSAILEPFMDNFYIFNNMLYNNLTPIWL